MPSVDFSDMESGQSDIRNKVLAPVFKRLGIIEQWGNGLKMIAEELKEYPEIEFKWKEPGIAFRITFTNNKYTDKQELQHESLYSKTLRLVLDKASSTKEISIALGQKSISGQLKKVLAKLRKDKLVEWTEPETHKSSKQKYRITPKGNEFLNLLNKK